MFFIWSGMMTRRRFWQSSTSFRRTRWFGEAWNRRWGDQSFEAAVPCLMHQVHTWARSTSASWISTTSSWLWFRRSSPSHGHSGTTSCCEKVATFEDEERRAWDWFESCCSASLFLEESTSFCSWFFACPDHFWSESPTEWIDGWTCNLRHSSWSQRGPARRSCLEVLIIARSFIEANADANLRRALLARPRCELRDQRFCFLLEAGRSEVDGQSLERPSFGVYCWISQGWWRKATTFFVWTCSPSSAHAPDCCRFACSTASGQCPEACPWPSSILRPFSSPLFFWRKSCWSPCCCWALRSFFFTTELVCAEWDPDGRCEGRREDNWGACGWAEDRGGWKSNWEAWGWRKERRWSGNAEAER